MASIADIRKDYKLKNFLETDAKADAIEQFAVWWQEAISSEIDEVNAMTLCTASADGKPSGRIVLLKGYDADGFIFFTNYISNKGKQLANNPQACLVFFWKELERQIRVEGVIEKIGAEESDTYFFSRPVGSQIGAWASPQSSIIENREVIERNVEKYEKEFAVNPVSRPAHWGGYRLVPNCIEFWQGRPSRLHDRLQYSLQENGLWKMERLAP
jgi:pyridoxamine 5'-phosphate oxidase